MPLRVVVVDDEPSILRSTFLLLQALGYEPTAVGRWEDALPTLVATDADVLLQDVQMPGLDLERLVDEIRSHPDLAKLSIVLFTAGFAAADYGESLGLPVLDKPFSPQQLHEVIAEARAQRHGDADATRTRGAPHDDAPERGA